VKDGRASEALASAQHSGLALGSVSPIRLPPYVRSTIDADFFLRVLFSALVDADFLDTERHFNPDNSALSPQATLRVDLWELFEANQLALTGKQTDALSRIRHEIYLAACRRHEGFDRHLPNFEYHFVSNQPLGVRVA
jgi:CRISPR-associated endonuclease/helicase Cas3